MKALFGFCVAYAASYASSYISRDKFVTLAGKVYDHFTDSSLEDALAEALAPEPVGGDCYNPASPCNGRALCPYHDDCPYKPAKPA